MRKVLFITSLLVLIVFISGCVQEERQVERQEEKPKIEERYFPGWAPGSLGLAITPDGKTAYIPFELDDALLVVNLSTFAIIDSIDVSEAGNMLLSTAAVLSPDGKKLYVSNYGTRNVMVVDTENNRIEKVLPLNPFHAVAIAISRDGSKAYAPSVDGGLYVINTSDNSYNRIFIHGVIFGPVVPSSSNPELVYTVGTLIEPPEDIFHPSFFVFNVSSNTVVRSSNLSEDVLPPFTPVRRFIVDSNETTAFFGWLGGADKGVGNFVVFDLNSFQVAASTPMENGVPDFAVDGNTRKAYVLGFWAGGGAPQELPIVEYDLSTNKVSRKILLSPSSDQRAIAIDPINADYLYMTEGDFNFIRKVEIATGKEVGRVQFNKANVRPYFIIRGGDNVGYISSSFSGEVYKLNLTSGQLMDSIPSPRGAPHAGGYYKDKLYFLSGRQIYSVNSSDGSLIETFDVGTDINVITLTFFNDKMAAIDYEGMMIGRRLLFFDANTMSVLKAIDLSREPYGDKVIASPDASKLYVTHGTMMGETAVINVFNASSLEIINTIEIPPSGIGRRGATGFVEADFDEENRILYLTGFGSIYKIGMDSDKLITILDLMDVYDLQNVTGWSPTGLSGVVLSQAKDKIFIVSGDAHSMYTYDISKSSWTTKITNLKGYFVTDAVSSLDRQYLYTVNQYSDSIIMVDLTSGDVVKIIPLT